MKKIILILMMILCAGLALASDVCTSVPGCEGETNPRGIESWFFTDNSTYCDWYEKYTTPPYMMYFDACKPGGEWQYYSGAENGTRYYCYNCDNLGRDCDTIRTFTDGSSPLVCYDCDCRDYLSGFPPLPCAPLTGDDCVDEKCCVEGDSFTDYRDGMIYTGNHGRYTSCVAQARKECGLIPSKESTDIQKSAAQSPTGKAIVEFSGESTWMGLISIASIISLVVVTLNAFNKLKK